MQWSEGMTLNQDKSLLEAQQLINCTVNEIQLTTFAEVTEHDKPELRWIQVHMPYTQIFSTSALHFHKTSRQHNFHVL